MSNEAKPQPDTSPPAPRRHWRTRTIVGLFVGVVLLCALAVIGATALLVSIYRHKEEARNPWLWVVRINEDTTDPAQWGKNWPREYDTYERTAERTATRYGGGGGESMAQQKLDRDPWLKRLFAGYAFSVDYRDRRGHYYMLQDQEQTERVTQAERIMKKQQPGACLHCHSSIMPTYRKAGDGDVMKGFEAVCAMTYNDAHALLAENGSMNPVPDGTKQDFARAPGAHPVSCVDCHSPQNMELRVTRPGFITGIKALKAHQGIKDYDPNRDASRQEMRSYVCGQCHVEYYFRGDHKTLTFPWANGLTATEIEKYYETAGADGKPFVDWKHGETGAGVLKAQHPEFETWSQGIHSQRGVACADCHMPYMRSGAVKVSDHWVRSPMLNIASACQTCHPRPEAELKTSVERIQERQHDLIDRSAKALTAMLDSIKAAKTDGATDTQLAPAFAFQRRGQWRLDFCYAENSMGFHAPQESARVLAEAIDYFRQGQLAAEQLRLRPSAPGATVPTTEPVKGVTP